MYACQSSNSSCYQTAYNQNGYGGMAYYSSATCGNGTYTGCTTDYEQSEIKYIVDAWKTAKAPLVTEARLITLEELKKLGYEWYDDGSFTCWQKTDSTPEWIMGENYLYWTMSADTNKEKNVWLIGKRSIGRVFSDNLDDYYGNAVRPVITLSKSVLN